MRIAEIQRSSRAVAAAVLAACSLASCAGTAHSGSGGPVIAVTERDFRISMSIAHVAAGEVTLRVHNFGPDQHELIVVPASNQRLPLRSDGLTVNEELLQSSEPGFLEPGAAESIRWLGLRLAPGRYVLFCNMAGHFMGGMRTTLVVTS